MLNRFCIAFGFIAGPCAIALAMQLWRPRRHPSLSSKYAAQLRERISEQEADFNNNEDAAIMVFYGSVTGNAEMYAKALVADLRERGGDVALVDPSTWRHLARRTPSELLFAPKSNEGKAIAVFVIATTGEGEVPDNFFPLFSEMQAAIRDGTKEGKQPFQRVAYAVFALGESSYRYFCRAGVSVGALLHNGGGVELLPIVLSDARSPTRDDLFDEWEENLSQKLQEVCGVRLREMPCNPPQPQLIFRFVTDMPADRVPFAPPPSLLEPSVQCPGQFVLEAKTRKTEMREDGSYVLHLAFGFGDHMVSYQAGDHLGIYPVNPPDVVEAYRQVLNISEVEWTKPVELCAPVNARARASLRNTLPARVTLCTVFERYLDLCGKPRKSMLRLLARCCENPQEQNSLLGILCGKYKPNISGCTESVPEMLCQGYSTVLHYLKTFPSCCRGFDVGLFVEAMPRIQPRFYSIASDILSHSTSVEIFVRIVPHGVNSTYLHHLTPGDRVTAFVRKSTFHLPLKCRGRPVVMIGPGTGVASMIGFCHRREMIMKKQPQVEHGPMVLFFGNRYRASEYFVREELRRWSPQGEGKVSPAGDTRDSVLTLADAAFSRDQPERYYVTHLMEKHRDYLVPLLMSRVGGGCIVYVSGDASSMSHSVDRAMVGLLEYGGMTREAAGRWLQRMEEERRYLKDTY